MKKYQFEVPALFSYEIKAETEADARKILVEHGGIDIDGELLIESENYNQAKLIEVKE